MTIRIIVRESNYAEMTAHGGGHLVSFRTFDIEARELEAALRAAGPGSMRHAEVVGAELQAEICWNCESPLPRGCEGQFKDEATCRLNPATKGKAVRYA